MAAVRKAKTDHLKIMSVGTDPEVQELIQRALLHRGYQVICCADIEKAIGTLEFSKVDIIVSEMAPHRISGFDLLRHVKKNFPEIEMMVYGLQDVQTAVKAIKGGAEDYLARPFGPDELSVVVQRMGGKIERREKPGSAAKLETTHGIVGRCNAVNTVLGLVKKAAATMVNVLIYGESGTEKELVARAIHYNSDRSRAPFVSVNCTTTPDTLLESELFGRAGGAFTGARESRTGFFQIADGGTIFLDKIGDASLNMQGKLLRVLQSKDIHIVGSSHVRKVDTRIIAATHKDLQAMVARGQFKEDLHCRLNLIDVTVPPLRERMDDLLLLIHHFSEKFSKEMSKTTPIFSDDTLQAMKNYHWPGNVRELENLIQQLLVIADDPVIQMADMPPHMRLQVEPRRDRFQTLVDIEAAHIRTVLSAMGGNKTRASKILGIDRKTLRTKLQHTDAAGTTPAG